MKEFKYEHRSLKILPISKRKGYFLEFKPCKTSIYSISSGLLALTCKKEVQIDP